MMGRSEKVATVLAYVMVAVAMYATVSLLQGSHGPTPSPVPTESVRPAEALSVPFKGLPEVLRLPACEDTEQGSASCVLFDEGRWYVLDTPAGGEQTEVRPCEHDLDRVCVTPRPNSHGTFNLYLS